MDSQNSPKTFHIMVKRFKTLFNIFTKVSKRGATEKSQIDVIMDGVGVTEETERNHRWFGRVYDGKRLVLYRENVYKQYISEDLVVDWMTTINADLRAVSPSEDEVFLETVLNACRSMRDVQQQIPKLMKTRRIMSSRPVGAPISGILTESGEMLQILQRCTASQGELWGSVLSAFQMILEVLLSETCDSWKNQLKSGAICEIKRQIGQLLFQTSEHNIGREKTIKTLNQYSEHQRIDLLGEGKEEHVRQNIIQSLLALLDWKCAILSGSQPILGEYLVTGPNLFQVRIKEVVATVIKDFCTDKLLFKVVNYPSFAPVTNLRINPDLIIHRVAENGKTAIAGCIDIKLYKKTQPQSITMFKTQMEVYANTLDSINRSEQENLLVRVATFIGVFGSHPENWCRSETSRYRIYCTYINSSNKREDINRKIADKVREMLFFILLGK